MAKHTSLNYTRCGLASKSCRASSNDQLCANWLGELSLLKSVWDLLFPVPTKQILNLVTCLLFVWGDFSKNQAILANHNRHVYRFVCLYVYIYRHTSKYFSFLQLLCFFVITAVSVSIHSLLVTFMVLTFLTSFKFFLSLCEFHIFLALNVFSWPK